MASKLGRTDNWTDVSPSEAVNPDSETLFQVTVKQVIGTVTVGGNGGYTPREAAFALIARFGADGVFEFPNQDGDPVVVMVETARSQTAPSKG